MSSALVARYQRREVRETGGGKALRYSLYASIGMGVAILAFHFWTSGWVTGSFLAVLAFAPTVIAFALLGTHHGRIRSLRTGPVAAATVAEHVPVAGKYGVVIYAKLTCAPDGTQRVAQVLLDPLPPVGTEIPVVYFANSITRLEPLTHRRDYEVTPLG